MSDFQNHFQLAGGILDEEAEVGTAGADLAADDQAFVSDDRRGRHAQTKKVRSDLQCVFFSERRALANAGAVDVSAVAAAHILDEEIAVDADDASVMPADGLGLQADRRIRLPAQDHGVLLQRILPAGVGSFQGDEISHALVLTEKGGQNQFKIRNPKSKVSSHG